MCESYYKAIRTATPSQIETIDMARRGLHNEGSEILRERLHGKVEVDFDTARRLFTLVMRPALARMSVAGDLPGAVLFACTQNAIRSPMAAGLDEAFLRTQGVRRIVRRQAGRELDPFVIAVMDEIGIDMSKHRPQSFDDLEDSSFDLVISLSPEAHHRALEMTRTMAIEAEYWPTLDPSVRRAIASRCSMPIGRCATD